MAGAAGSGGIGIQFGSPSAPAAPTPPAIPPGTNPQFIVKPGSPRKMRVITMSRSKTMGGRGKAPSYSSWTQREVATTDTMSSFVPTYQKFASEFAAFKNFTDPTKLAAVEAILTDPRRTDDSELMNDLNRAYPGISDALRGILLAQYSRGEAGIMDNILSLGDADLFQRLNSFGTGTHFRAEILAIIHNSKFLNDITPSGTDKEIKITRTSDNLTLVEGQIDEEKKVVLLKIGAQVGPQDRDEALKQLVLMAACHTQQNNSNLFMPTFGDNIYENIRLLQLAIGEFNLRIPQYCIDSQIQTIQDQINAISDPQQQQQAQDNWNFWASKVETFKDKFSSSGANMIDNHHRPRDADGKALNLEDTQKMLRDRPPLAGTRAPRPT